MDFTYEIEVLKPHPFFSIKPIRGIIPGNNSVDIVITFNPITLGTCTTTIRLNIAQHGFQPKECVISARAVSGLLENRELAAAEKRIRQYIESTGDKVHEDMSNAIQTKASKGLGIPQNLTLKSNDIHGNIERSYRDTNTSLQRQSVVPAYDPVTTVLASTFRSPDLTGALMKAIVPPFPLASKSPGPSRDLNESSLTADKQTVRKPNPPQPRGPGAGQAFDAGSHWLTAKHRKQHLKMGGTNGASLLPPQPKEIIKEGLTIPMSLNSTTAVNAVLTQEAGKLKPKDLKAAIEKARLDRTQRAIDRETIRASGSGGLDLGGNSSTEKCGVLDVHALLAEERLNLAGIGDPYKRQLRELNFLTDSEQVLKNESDKVFRVSEEYLGAVPISVGDIELVEQQRKDTNLYLNQISWQEDLAKKFTEKFPPTHPTKKAGRSAWMSAVLDALNSQSGSLDSTHRPTLENTREKNTSNRQNVTENIDKLNEAKNEMEEDAISSFKVDLKTVPLPTFDVNSNDEWAKRRAALRRLVYLFSRWMIVRRAKVRLEKIRKRLAAAGATTREQVRALVTADAASQGANSLGLMNNNKGSNSKSTAPGDSNGLQVMNKSISPALLLFSLPNSSQHLREAYEKAISNETFEIEPTMIRRILMPKYVSDVNTERLKITFAGLDDGVTPFDDRTFIPLKVRPEYVALGYEKHKLPVVPLHFPSWNSKRQRKGASEELHIRPAVETNAIPSAQVKIEAKDASTVDESSELEASKDKAPGASAVPSSAAPSWMTAPVVWSSEEKDFFRPRPDLRVYSAAPKRTEVDLDWNLRPKPGRVLAEKAPANTLRDKYANILCEIFVIERTLCN